MRHATIAAIMISGMPDHQEVEQPGAHASTPVVLRLPLEIRPGNPLRDPLVALDRRRLGAQRRDVGGLPRYVPCRELRHAQRRRGEKAGAAGAGRTEESLFTRGRWVVLDALVRHRVTQRAAVGRRDISRRRRRARERGSLS